MATKNRLMAAGMPATNAGHLGADLSSTIAAAGTTQGTATAVTGSFTIVSTTPANTGVVLKNAGGQPDTVVYNGGANTLKVYPATGEQINNGTATTGSLSVPTTKAAIFVSTEGAWIGVVSA